MCSHRRCGPLVGMTRRLRALVRIVAVIAGTVLAVPVAEASFPGRNGRIAYMGQEAVPTVFDAPKLGVYTVRPDGTDRRLILRSEPYSPDLW